MTGNDPRAALYAQYETALEALLRVPERLAVETLAANQRLGEDLAAATSSTEADTDRLTQTRRAMISRYDDIAALLRDAATPMPESIRPARGKNGDARTLAAALTAHQDAESEVTRVLGESAEAAEALRRRQEHVQRQREEARAAADLRRHARQVRLRRLIIAGAVLAVLVIGFIGVFVR